jgi:hypothetical protein
MARGVMRHKRTIAVGCPLVALIAIGVAFGLLWPRSSAITWENIEKIHVGMTRAEVEAVLGGPARDESAGGTVFGTVGVVPEGLFEREASDWFGETCGVTVWFDDNGLVDWWLVTRVRQRPFFRRFLHRFGL